MRRLLLHEGRVHARPSRVLRDLGDAILLTDPDEPEPFWNRLEGLRWPRDPEAFDRRLTQALVQFATLARQPHIWASPIHDAPSDLVARLAANGFRDMGSGNVMVLTDPGPGNAALAAQLDRGVTIERLARVDGRAAERAAGELVAVLLDAFEADPRRAPALEQDTVVSLGHPWFTHYLVRVDGVPASVARRATFEGASYLSSIGTAGWARGRGLGGLITRYASADAVRAGSDWTYLGVFADNRVAIHTYERSGFKRVGRPAPDLLLM
ncbi:MAG: GNAT family N-acetyltransferase [Thermomicrobiales bacterium]|jgi:ribosomal protein S18 acetylase RimI-like enzyme|nr:MAG: GNAT family N-acetyltransferase [Thermomicrobiales bacterium]